MELVDTLGIDGRILLWQVVMFFVLLGVLRKFAYGPIIAALETRERKIAKGLTDAAAAEAARADADVLKRKTLVAATQEAEGIVGEAKKAAEAHRADALAKTRNEVERLLMDGQSRLEQERVLMINGAEKELEDLVASAVEKVLDRAVTDKDHAKFMKEAVAAAKAARL